MTLKEDELELFTVPFVGTAPMLSVGAVLSTLNVADGPSAAALFPNASEAVEDATEIPTVPSPVHEERVTVLVAVPDSVTLCEQVASPVVLREISPFATLQHLLPYKLRCM